MFCVVTSIPDLKVLGGILKEVLLLLDVILALTGCEEFAPVPVGVLCVFVDVVTSPPGSADRFWEISLYSIQS